MTVEFNPNPNPLQPVRIAIRSEGDWVVAYLIADALQFKQEMARIWRNALNEDEPLFDAWKGVLTAHLTRWIEAKVGVPVDHVEEKSNAG